MKARLIFYCAAVVALVLFLAATSSHATERRDPVLNPEQIQPANGHAKFVSSHPKRSSLSKKSAHASANTRPAQMPAQKKSPDGGAGSASKGK